MAPAFTVILHKLALKFVVAVKTAFLTANVIENILILMQLGDGTVILILGFMDIHCMHYLLMILLLSLIISLQKSCIN
jgi:hypothetical protein